MPTAGKQNGTLTYLMHDGTKIDFQTEVSFDFSMDIIDCTTKDSQGWKESMPGLRNSSISGTAYYAEDTTEGFSEIFAKLTSQNTSTLRVTTGVVGDTYIEFTGFVTNLSLSAGTEDVKSFSYTFEMSAPPTIGTEA